MEVLFLGLITGIIAAMIASNKGRGTGNWFVLGFLFSIAAIIILLILKPIEENVAKKEGLMKCTKCAEWIKREATVCKHCGHDIGQAQEGEAT